MLNFKPVNSKEITMHELIEGLTSDDLQRLTIEMIDAMLKLIEDCNDEDVTIVPDDPDAFDADAEDEADLELAWTLGHVIVHTTASSEEAAAIAAQLARGVPHRGGRSRSEVQWQSIRTIEECRYRLNESRRMRLAALAMWPEKPDLVNSFENKSGKPINAIYRFVAGLRHDDSHLEQIAKIVKQAKSARAVRIKVL